MTNRVKKISRMWEGHRDSALAVLSTNKARTNHHRRATRAREREMVSASPVGREVVVVSSHNAVYETDALGNHRVVNRDEAEFVVIEGNVPVDGVPTGDVEVQHDAIVEAELARLSTFTVAELRDIAKRWGLKPTTKWRKPQLIEEITNKYKEHNA